MAGASSDDMNEGFQVALVGINQFDQKIKLSKFNCFRFFFMYLAMYNKQDKIWNRGTREIH